MQLHFFYFIYIPLYFAYFNSYYFCFLLHFKIQKKNKTAVVLHCVLLCFGFALSSRNFFRAKSRAKGIFYIFSPFQLIIILIRKTKRKTKEKLRTIVIEWMGLFVVVITTVIHSRQRRRFCGQKKDKIRRSNKSVNNLIF